MGLYPQDICCPQISMGVIRLVQSTWRGPHSQTVLSALLDTVEKVDDLGTRKHATESSWAALCKACARKAVFWDYQGILGPKWAEGPYHCH